MLAMLPINFTVQVAYAQGLAAPNAKSTPIASFEVDINVDVNETVGLPTYKPHAPLTWQGTTELKTNILWTSLAGKPWKDTTFFFSTQVCRHNLLSSAALHFLLTLGMPEGAACSCMWGCILDWTIALQR
jgi:hypothetical protein